MTLPESKKDRSKERYKEVIPRHRDKLSTITNIGVSMNVASPKDINHLRTKLNGSKIKNSRLLSKSVCV